MEKGDALLQAYDGPYVVESFNPAAVHWYADHRPEVCRGQLAWGPSLEEAGLKEWAAGLLIFDWISRPDFIAYDWSGGNSPQMRLARAMGAVPVSWTVRSSDELAQCDDWFDHHIFEGSRGLSGFDAHFLGSVSKQLVNLAECTLTVVH